MLRLQSCSCKTSFLLGARVAAFVFWWFFQPEPPAPSKHPIKPELGAHFSLPRLKLSRLLQSKGLRWLCSLHLCVETPEKMEFVPLCFPGRGRFFFCCFDLSMLCIFYWPLSIESQSLIWCVCCALSRCKSHSVFQPEVKRLGPKCHFKINASLQLIRKISR